jgi:hypothetical protein
MMSNESSGEMEKRRREIFAKLAAARSSTGELDFVELEK